MDTNNNAEEKQKAFTIESLIGPISPTLDGHIFEMVHAQMKNNRLLIRIIVRPQVTPSIRIRRLALNKGKEEETSNICTLGFFVRKERKTNNSPITVKLNPPGNYK